MINTECFIDVMEASLALRSFTIDRLLHTVVDIFNSCRRDRCESASLLSDVIFAHGAARQVVAMLHR